MTRRKKIWLVIITTCAVWIIWELPNFLFLLRQYSSFQILKSEGSFRLQQFDTHLLSEEIKKSDPEVIVIAENLFTHDVDVNSIADSCLKYPKNDFLLSKLIYQILETDDLNPQIAYRFADELIQKDPDNAHFHYLKACATMQNFSPKEFHQVLKHIEEGNNCSKLNFSYDTYHQRLLGLLKKAKKYSIYHNWSLLPYNWLSHYRKLIEQIEQQVQTPSLYKDDDYSLKLINNGIVMSEKCLDKSRNALEFLISLSFLGRMCNAKHFHIDLDQDELLKTRYKRSLLHLTSERMKIEVTSITNQFTKPFFSGVSIIVFGFLLISTLPFYLLMLIIVYRGKSSNNCKVNSLSYILFPIGLILYSAISAFIALLTQWYPTYSYKGKTITILLPLLFAFVSLVIWLSFWLFRRLRLDNKISYKYQSVLAVLFCISLFVSLLIVPIYNFSWTKIFLFLIISIGLSTALWLILVYGWWLVKRLNQNRIVQLILVLIILAGLNTLCLNSWWGIIFPILSIVFVSIILVHSPSEKLPALIDGLIRIFSKKERMVITRCKIFRLLTTYIFVFLVFFLISTHITAFFLKDFFAQTKQIEDLHDYKPMPLPSKKHYQKVLEKLVQAEEHEEGFSMDRYITVVSPNDLPNILDSMKDAYEDDYYYNSAIADAIQSGLKELQKTLLDFIDDPNSEIILIARAKASDKSVKNMLQTLLIEKQHKINSEQDCSTSRTAKGFGMWGTSRLGDCFEVAGALAYISEPDESLARFLNLIEQYDLSQLQSGGIYQDKYKFYESLDSLPIREGTVVLKAYLNKTDYADIYSDQHIYKMEKALSIYADAEIAERVFQITCQNKLTKKSFLSSITSNTDNEFAQELAKSYDSAPDLRKIVAPYLTEQSIPLLKEQLNHEDENIRAFCVWQLAKLDYKWTSDELEQLLSDESWKVRANTLVAADEKHANAILNDQDPFVRTVVQLVTGTFR
ncbi:hypothetical protein ACFL1G_10840 [Planctomycetota bacterium]